MRHTLILAFLLVILNGVKAQTSNGTGKYPEQFFIEAADLNTILSLAKGEKINAPANAYIHQSVVIASTKNGDMQFMKLKLGYFPKSSLMIQVNGEYSTQVYILSDDKSLSYKGKVEKGRVTLTQCSQDEIVSE